LQDLASNPPHLSSETAFHSFTPFIPQLNTPFIETTFHPKALFIENYFSSKTAFHRKLLFIETTFHPKALFIENYFSSKTAFHPKALFIETTFHRKLLFIETTFHPFELYLSPYNTDHDKPSTYRNHYSRYQPNRVPVKKLHDPSS